MASKYYAHFVAESLDARGNGEQARCGRGEDAAAQEPGETRELRSRSARNLDLSTDEIRILQWARLH